MSETVTVGLTTDQRKLLLSGLRFLRSSISMELIEPSEDSKVARDARMQQVRELEAQLGNSE
ncbi:hypothetical protein [Calycomorphotria hydatis]|nr:hypothetical protein [Calycomorphotria hydatis]